MLPAGFEPTIPASERPQAHALDRAGTVVGLVYTLLQILELQFYFVLHSTSYNHSRYSIVK